MRHAVIVLDRLLEGRELENVDNRGEDLLIHDCGVGADLNDCWLDVVSWSRKLLATCQDAAALRLNLLEALQVVTDTVLAVHWAHESISSHRISDRHILV